MNSTINFGIDLGTTNSLIAKYENGKVEIFKNPIGHKETLPSVVAYRKNRTLIGDKAREYLEKDSKNVAALFKRKMGTSDSYFIDNLSDTVSPETLSSEVLKELKNFIHTGESTSSVVITIPASFDTVQSNATVQAGKLAGFSDVLLLQEPVAAGLAFFNKEEVEEETGNWLVYDLGGGTFDVAYLSLDDGEIKVVDHKGDNYLGGADIDNSIIYSLIIPKILEAGSFDSNFKHQLTSNSGKYSKLYFILLKKAEELKIQLSSSTSADFELELEDDNGEEIDLYFEITRSQFEDLIRPLVTKTIDFTKKLIRENNLQTDDLNKILLIGGSTFIPLVRNMMTEAFSTINIDYSIDPTTAVVIGAAYYAGSRKKTISSSPVNTINNEDISVKTAFQKHTNTSREFFLAKVSTDDFSNKQYRIIRKDGGFDSGNKALNQRIDEMLPLVENANNQFELKVIDDKNTILHLELFDISHGTFNVLGQPLPDDICLEVDDIEEGETKLELIFQKNSTLPLKKIITKELSKTIRSGSDDKLIINVLEGPQYTTPASNKPIGVVEINGKNLDSDIIKGTDIEITIHLTESRELSISTYLLMADQEFENIFKSQQRYVSLHKLQDEISDLKSRLLEGISMSEESENYEDAGKYQKYLVQLDTIKTELLEIPEDDITDRKFQLEDSKRQIAFEIDKTLRIEKMEKLISEYVLAKMITTDVVESYGNELYNEKLNKLLAKDHEVISSLNRGRIRKMIKDYNRLNAEASYNSDSGIIEWYYEVSMRDDFLDPQKSQKLIKEGNKMAEDGNSKAVRAIMNELFKLLPAEEKNKFDIDGTGLK